MFQFLMPSLGGLLFGWAAVRSGGLALPIGLHLGGNWVQAAVPRFSLVSEQAASKPIQSIWRVPVSASDVQTLYSPDLIPRLPYIVAVAIAALLTARILRAPWRQATVQRTA